MFASTVDEGGIEKDDDYKPFRDIFDNMSVVISSDKKLFNIIDDNGELLSDEWFVYIAYNTTKTKNGEFVVVHTYKYSYKLYSDGRLIRIE